MNDAAPPPAWLTDDDEIAAPKRKRRVDVEHCTQKHVMQFVRDAVAVPHLFLAFDRSAPFGRFSHMRQKARGLVAGTPDTLLIADGKHVWVEMKAPGKKPTDEQIAFGVKAKALGEYWDFSDSVLHYYHILCAAGVPLREGAWGIAYDHQARAESEIERAQLRAGKLPARLRPAKPSAATIRRARKAGVLV